MQRAPITILGAGIGGLTLGRCLRQKGIPSVIYDRASSAPRHSYGITLEPWAYKPLLGALNIDEPAFKKQIAVDSLAQGGFGQIYPKDSGTSGVFRANRSELESMLREEQDIQSEHLLESATTSNDGSVELQFKNGTTLQPSLIIDALGVHSPLRKSLVPNASPEVEPFAVFNGKRYISGDIFNSTYAPALGKGNVLVRSPSRAGEPRLEISINDLQSDGNISISYIYSRAARNGSDPLHRPERSNAGATNIPEEFYTEVQEVIAGLNGDQPFADCFSVDTLRDERLLHWLMRTILVPKEDLHRLLQHGVVMIGDAAHAVPILGGHGANIAIKDAIDLASVIAENNGDATGLKQFYEKKWQSWHDAVEESKKELAEMHQPSSQSGPNL